MAPFAKVPTYSEHTRFRKISHNLKAAFYVRKFTPMKKKKSRSNKLYDWPILYLKW